MVEMIKFFHEATLRICGSLEIETVAKDCLEYLKDFIPLDGISIHYYDERKRAIIILATASEISLNLDDTVVPVSPEAHEHFKRTKETVIIYNNPEDGPVPFSIWKTLGRLDKSSIVLFVVFKGKRLGQIDFFCRGRNRYTKKHANLIMQLYQPFSIAMANSLQYREIVNVKELLMDDNRFLRQELHRMPATEIIGSWGGLRDVMKAVEQVAPLTSNVLLLGETGVGKEVISNAIHYASPRRNGPFVKFNCGAIPEGLINTELYGHEKGSFTGALSRKYGRFELANGGTIFLDEVGDLPAHAQSTLLRVLQEKEIERVGGTKPIKVDVRVIAATNKNLEEMAREGSFRYDLFFRLNVFPIVIPPLRERKGDIPELVNFFIRKKLQEMNLGGIPTILPGTMEKLMAYDWPGNVRELENAVERALIRRRALDPQKPLGFEDFLSEQMVQASSPRSFMFTEVDDVCPLDNVMREHIEKALRRTGGKIQGPDGAAALLGVKPNTLRHRMRKLGIAFGRKSQHGKTRSPWNSGR
ncbi:MAG: sigma 54-interacting transcriptional regulator [Desulfomonilia bacterium]